MTPKARKIVLTESQAACLIALRRLKDSKTEIAIQRGSDLPNIAARKGGMRPHVGKPAASRPFRIDCSATVGPVPAPGACSNC